MSGPKVSKHPQQKAMRLRMDEIRIPWAEYRAFLRARREEGGVRAGQEAEPLALIREKIARKLGRGARPEDVRDLTLVRKSVDARDKKALKIVFAADFTFAGKLPGAKGHKGPGLQPAPDLTYQMARPQEGALPLRTRPVIAGFGPCGIFAAYVLARQGYRPIVLERGGSMESRVAAVEAFRERGVLDPECNVQFGEGGAGTFSDGKLTTGIKDPRIRFVLETFAAAGADPAILYDQKPHVGTDVLRVVVRNLRDEIIACGGTVLFGCRLEDPGKAQAEGGVRKVRVHCTDPKSLAWLQAWPEAEQVGGAEPSEADLLLPAEVLVLAIGHSARDTFATLHSEGFSMEQKAFSIGVRIEHPQAWIDAAQYGEEVAAEGLLPPASYKLAMHTEEGRGVYTFCMCPGGEVICASSEPGGLVTNGMSEHARATGRANSGLLVDVRPSDFGDPDDPLAGVAFQRKYERLAFENGGGNYRIPEATWGAVRDGLPEGAPVIRSLPDFAVSAIREAMPVFGRRLKKFDDEEAVFRATETRSSSPVRILRDPGSLEAIDRPGIFPGGEGAGYAGGITSSACDGIRIAEQIIRKWEKPQG